MFYIKSFLGINNNFSVDHYRRLDFVQSGISLLFTGIEELPLPELDKKTIPMLGKDMNNDCQLKLIALLFLMMYAN